MNINATLLGQTVAFVIFIAICWKYVWPPIIAIMEEREKRIADGLEAAKKADDSLEEAQLAFDQEMNKAKADAAETAAGQQFEDENPLPENERDTDADTGLANWLVITLVVAGVGILSALTYYTIKIIKK